MPTTGITPRRFRTLISTTLALTLLTAGAVLAQDPVVNSADPSSAEQETYDLDVIVSGDNFGADSVVDFFVTGTQDPGGIHVKKVKRQGPKTLKVTIDVASDAQTLLDFDIQVQTRGRTGKGIELFRVIEKTNQGQDTIPPGTPTNLQVREVTYGSVLVSFTMPADDGYDPASGPASHCSIFVTPRGGDPLWSTADPPWGQPGEEEWVILGGLYPETTYSFSLSCFDEVGGNESGTVEFTETTYPFSAFQDLSWAVTEVPVHLDYLVGHRFDAAGNVVIAGTVGTYTKKGWRTILVSSAIRIITGTWDSGSGSWNWSFEDVTGFANRLASHPGGRPAFAGQELTDRTPRAAYEVTYTFFDGSTWETEVVSSFETEAAYGASPGFAFDPFGQPGITWCAGASSPGVRLARRDPTGQWSIENVNSAYCDSRTITVLAFDNSGNPAIVWTHREDPYELRFSYGSPQGWSEEFVDTLRPGNPWKILPVGLGFDPVRSDFTTVWASEIEVSFCDRNGVAAWDCGPAMPFGSGTESEMAWHPTGEVMFGAWTPSRGDEVLAWQPPYDPNNPGQELTWTLEHVDHWTTHGLPTYFDQAGPFVALDTLDRPTLSYLLGNIGGDEGPSEEVHLYFAWKESP